MQSSLPDIERGRDFGRSKTGAGLEDTRLPPSWARQERERSSPTSRPGKGEPRAELSSVHMLAVHRYVSRRVANPADAADITQQALLLAWAKRDTRQNEGFSHWLMAIARNLVVDHYRATNRFQFVGLKGLAETTSALQSCNETETHERRERLRIWLDDIALWLHPEEQVAVLLADVYAYRGQDSATLLGMSLPSFKLLLHGARARLHAIADGGIGEAAAPEKPAGSLESHAVRRAAEDTSGIPRAAVPAPRHRTPVICPLAVQELVALRNRLRAGVPQVLGVIVSLQLLLFEQCGLLDLSFGLEEISNLPWA